MSSPTANSMATATSLLGANTKARTLLVQPRPMKLWRPTNKTDVSLCCGSCLCSTTAFYHIIYISIYDWTVIIHVFWSITVVPLPSLWQQRSNAWVSLLTLMLILCFPASWPGYLLNSVNLEVFFSNYLHNGTHLNQENKNKQ